VPFRDGGFRVASTLRLPHRRQRKRLTKAAMGVSGWIEKRKSASRVSRPVCPHLRHWTVTFGSSRERIIRSLSFAAFIRLCGSALLAWPRALRRCAVKRILRADAFRGDAAAERIHQVDDVLR
jgi:hypothetical protein